MALDVPEPVAAYLAAEEAKDADALSSCFTDDGIVHDEGQDYRGREAIPEKETRGGHEIPIPPAADQRSNAWRQSDRTCPTHR